MTIISTTVGKNSLEEMEQPSQSTKESEVQNLDAISNNDRMISLCFQGKPFYITVIQVYAPTSNAEKAEVESNAEKAEVEQLYEDLQDLLELTPKKDVLLIIGGWNAKVGSLEIPGITGKFDLGVEMTQGKG